MMIEKLKSLDFRWLLAELVVIVLGILIAFQVEQWRDNSREREQEVAGLRAILTDIEIGRMEYEYFIQSTKLGVEGALDYIEFLQQSPPPNKNDIENIPLTINRRLWRPTNSSFNSLRDSGQLSLISSQALQRNLIEYFDTVEPYFLDRRLNYTSIADELITIYSSFFRIIPKIDYKESMETHKILNISADEYLSNHELVNILIEFVRRGKAEEQLAIQLISRLNGLELAILDHLSSIE